MQTKNVFITGATGYVGQSLVPALLARGHRVRTLVRPESKHRAPTGCEVILGNPLAADSFTRQIPPSDTLVQLVGVPHPSPAKAALFRSIDLVSAQASVAAAVTAQVRHFIYVSVAQPAPVMKAYQEVRSEIERLIRQQQFRATLLRPWYILGPGHQWPRLLLPMYWMCELIPFTRKGARRLGLVTLPQMVGTLVHAVENPPDSIRVIEVPEIRLLGAQAQAGAGSR